MRFSGFFLFFLFPAFFSSFDSAIAADPVPGATSAPVAAPVPNPTPAAASAPVTTSAPVAAPGLPAPVHATGSATDYKKFRDPFREPEVAEIQEHRTDLERYAVTDFKLVAVVTGPLRMRAMIVAPDGKTHYVSEKMKIGLRDGVITKITTKSIIVKEKVVNPLGEVEFFNTELSLDQPTEARNFTP